MFKYHEELDTDFYLPIVKRRGNDNSINIEMPNDFFDKYNMLFDLIEELNIMLCNLEINNLKNEKDLLSFLKEKISFLNEIKRRTTKNQDLYKYLLLYGEIVDILYNLNLYNIEKNKFLKIMQSFNSALLDIGYKQDKITNYYFNNTWFITQNGNLFNTISSNHFSADFENYYIEFKNKFINGDLKFEKAAHENQGKINPFPEYSDLNWFKTNGYARFIILDSVLHFRGYVLFNGKCFDPRYLKIMTGKLETRASFCGFLEDLHMYTSDPIKELNKVIELTKDHYDDVLVRCCGASKVLYEHNIIVTSHLNYEYKFKEYINKGWDIRFIPPIIINKEKGIVEEYSEDFLKILTFRKQY